MSGLTDLYWDTLLNDKFIYNNVDLTIKNNLYVSNNLNIKYNLFLKKLYIKNNGFFKSSIIIKNYINNIKDRIIVKEDCNIYKKIIFSNELDTITNKSIHINITQPNTYFTLKNYVNTFNLNIGNFTVNEDIITQGNINVDEKLNILQNLICKDNLNINNTIHPKTFNINNDINLNNIKVYNNLNIKGNLNLKNLTSAKGLFIENNLNVKNGVFVLPNDINLNQKKLISYNSITNTIEANCSKTVILTDFHGYQFKSNINIYDNNHNIDFIVDKHKKLELTKYNLNLSYESILNNSTIFNNTYVYNNLNINHNLNIFNNTIINNLLQLPYDSVNNFSGSLTFNTNTRQLNVIYDDKLTDLQFLDKNNTGIFKNDNIYFNIKNNNIITFNNNTFIKNYVNFNNNLNIDDSLIINNNLHTESNINIHNIPIQLYNNILRSYNFITQKWTSLTLENYNSYYKIPYKSYTFYLKNINTNYNYCNTFNYNTKDILLNNSNIFIYEIISHFIYITHLFFNIINLSNNNTYYIQIYKKNNITENNEILLDTITINNNLQIIKLNNTIQLQKNNILFIKIKSFFETSNNTIILNLLGHYTHIIDLKGDSNFITDSLIDFNQNTTLNINTTFYKNINITNTLNLINIPNNKVLNVPALSVEKKNHDTLVNINDFSIKKNGKINIGNSDNNSFISINNSTFKTAFLTTGGMACQSNVNILNNLITNNINVNNNINTVNLLTNDLIINKNISITNNLEVLNTTFIKGNVNLINVDLETNKFIITKNLFINKFDNSIKNSLQNNSIYLSTYNNNLLLNNKNNSLIEDYIYHNKINTVNNNININHLHINYNNVSLFSNSNNLFNIKSSNKSIFSILPNGNFNISNDLILNNINISSKIKSIIYDIYGPKNVSFYYNFINNNNVIIYNYNTIYKNLILDNTYFKIFIKNNIYYTQLTTYPYYNLRGFDIYYDIIYFTEIILKDYNNKNFLNNILSYKIHNPYNYNITIYYSNNGQIIYPQFNTNLHINYGLKTEIK